MSKLVKMVEHLQKTYPPMPSHSMILTNVDLTAQIQLKKFIRNNFPLIMDVNRTCTMNYSQCGDGLKIEFTDEFLEELKKHYPEEFV